MLKQTILGILLLIATAANVSAREVSPRLIKLGQAESSEAQLICDQAPYCYKFDAVVDIDSGSLRVWAVDQEGTAFVYNRLYKGERVQVRSVYNYKGEWRAQIVAMYPACARIDGITRVCKMGTF